MLTPKQEKFVRNLVSGMSQREAYRNSYNVKKMKPTSMDKKASALFARVDIRGRYDELVKKANEKAEIKAEDILLELKAIALQTEQTLLTSKMGNFTLRIQKTCQKIKRKQYLVLKKQKTVSKSMFTIN